MSGTPRSSGGELPDPERDEERKRARSAGVTRLDAVGIGLDGRETDEEIGDLVDAVERFEQAVEARGGDLMVDEGPHGRTLEPDNPEFVLPSRQSGEAAAAFVRRVDEVALRLRQQPERR